MIEKKEAIDKGVKDRMKDLESDMVDEMMQAALNLDVDNEIEKRIRMAKQMVEEGRIDESASKSITGSQYKQKKNVKFQASPKAEKYSSSATSQYKQEHESSLRSKSSKNNIGESMGQDDMIGESIAMEESIAQSSAKKSKVDSSGKYSNSKSKISDKQEDENSLSRDEEDDIEEEYSNDFASKSVQSATVSSKKNKMSSMKDQNMEESGYSESFEQMSNLGQSQSQSKGGLKSMTNQDFNEIEVVNEDDDEQIVSPEESLKKRSPDQSAVQDPTMSDREVVESTRSVQWEIQLQEPRQETPSPAPQSPSEEEIEEDPTEQYISEDYDAQADEMQDLESNPTGSLAGSYPKEEDLETRADQITDELLNQILADFENDQNVKMVVEDDIDEDEFEDKWPYSLDKKVEEPENPMSPSLPSTQQAAPVDENQENNIAKQRHDILLKKYHAEQEMLKNQHLKTKEYLDFITQIVDKEVLQSNLQKPIEHDPLKILEKIQAFDTEDEIEMTSNSQQQSALPTYLFDEIQKRYEEVHTAEKSEGSQDREESKNISQEAQQVHHLAIFDAFNEALDLERPYKFKGLPNPWSKQTRITKENITTTQVDQIVQKAMERVIGWDATGAGTKYAPAPPPPPMSQDYDMPQKSKTDEERKAQEKQEEDDRNKAERSERLGILLTKEVHQKENDWLDYEIEDTQVRFDLADMILEELADEATQFLIMKQQPNLDVSGGSQFYE